MTDAAFSDAQLATIRLLIQAQTEQLLQASPEIILRPATVESYAASTQATTALIDGLDTVATPCLNITGVALTEGQRVMVLFQRPHGAFVIGFAAPP